MRNTIPRIALSNMWHTRKSVSNDTVFNRHSKWMLPQMFKPLPSATAAIDSLCSIHCWICASSLLKTVRDSRFWMQPISIKRLKFCPQLFLVQTNCLCKWQLGCFFVADLWVAGPTGTCGGLTGVCYLALPFADSHLCLSNLCRPRLLCSSGRTFFVVSFCPFSSGFWMVVSWRVL